MTDPTTTAHPVSRGRKSVKVRTGCTTCRKRKVKCDEAKPSCLRCSRSGRTCDGYRVLVPSTALAGVIRSSPDFDNPDEALVFDHYLRRTGDVLGGELDAEFWKTFVLQLSLSQPAVKHGILAISSLHKRANHLSSSSSLMQQQQQQSSGLDSERFSLSHYNQAVSALRSWLSESSGKEKEPHILLSVCLLFVCIEFLRANEHAAHLHIRHARTMLSQIDKSNSSAIHIVREKLLPIYTRLGLTSLFFGQWPAPIPSFLLEPQQVGMRLSMDSLEAARNSLYNIMDKILDFTMHSGFPDSNVGLNSGCGDSLLDQRDVLLDQLEQWAISFAALTAMQPTKSQPTVTANILQLYYHTSKIWISTVLEQSELAYDTQLSSFSSIITLASTIVGYIDTSPRSSTLFSFEAEVLPPLYWTGLKCRHPILRRAALALLQRESLLKRSENLWQARDLIATVSRVISVEEAGLASTNEIDVSNIEPPRDTETVPDHVGNTKETHTTLASGKSSTKHDHPSDELGTVVSSHPFGIPESARIRHVTYAPHHPDGIYVTMFTKSDHAGGMWKSHQGFVAFSVG